MVLQCCIVGCGANSLKWKEVSFFKIDRDPPEWRQALIEIVNRTDSALNIKHARICSRHFTEDSFSTSIPTPGAATRDRQSSWQCGPKRVLIPGSMPTLFLPKGSLERVKSLKKTNIDLIRDAAVKRKNRKCGAKRPTEDNILDLEKECPICGMGFVYSRFLEAHMKLHNKQGESEKQQREDSPPKHAQQSQLRITRSQREPNRNGKKRTTARKAKPKKKKLPPCRTCGARIHGAAQLASHMMKMHNEVWKSEPELCAKCGESLDLEEPPNDDEYCKKCLDEKMNISEVNHDKDDVADQPETDGLCTPVIGTITQVCSDDIAMEISTDCITEPESGSPSPLSDSLFSTLKTWANSATDMAKSTTDKANSTIEAFDSIIELSSDEENESETKSLSNAKLDTPVTPQICTSSAMAVPVQSQIHPNLDSSSSTPVIGSLQPFINPARLQNNTNFVTVPATQVIPVSIPPTPVMPVSVASTPVIPVSTPPTPVIPQTILRGGSPVINISDVGQTGLKSVVLPTSMVMFALEAATRAGNILKSTAVNSAAPKNMLPPENAVIDLCADEVQEENDIAIVDEPNVQAGVASSDVEKLSQCPITIEPSATPIKHQCPQCGKLFKNSRCLSAHLMAHYMVDEWQKTGKAGSHPMFNEKSTNGAPAEAEEHSPNASSHASCSRDYTQDQQPGLQIASVECLHVDNSNAQSGNVQSSNVQSDDSNYQSGNVQSDNIEASGNIQVLVNPNNVANEAVAASEQSASNFLTVAKVLSVGGHPVEPVLGSNKASGHTRTEEVADREITAKTAHGNRSTNETNIVGHIHIGSSVPTRDSLRNAVLHALKNKDETVLNPLDKNNSCSGSKSQTGNISENSTASAKDLPFKCFLCEKHFALKEDVVKHLHSHEDDMED